MNISCIHSLNNTNNSLKELFQEGFQKIEVFLKNLNRKFVKLELNRFSQKKVLLNVANLSKNFDNVEKQ